MTSLERIHLAQELHDGIAQDLVAIGYSLDILLDTPDINTSSRQEIRTLRFAVSNLIEKVRDEMFDLRNGAHIAFSNQIELDGRKALVQFGIELNLEECPWFESDSRKDQVLKISREIMRNIVQHSQATNVGITLKSTQNDLQLVIQDNGRGGVSPTSYGMGLVGILERTSAIRGTIDYTSDSSGTCFTIRIKRE